MSAALDVSVVMPCLNEAETLGPSIGRARDGIRHAGLTGEVVVADTWLPGDVRPSVCAPGCCPNLRAAKPALCGSD